MDIKGSGVIHPLCLSSIIENILMEIDQLNINNNHFEELDINLHISNNVKGHRWRPSEKNINHHLIEREDSINIHLVHGIVMNINKIREDINKILGMDGTSILDSISHRTQTWHFNVPSEQDESGTATSYRGSNISDHLSVSSSSRTSASSWARQQDGGHRTRIHLNIFHLEASWHVATWSSSTTKMNAIILTGDPVDHHDLIPDILSQSITYILNINKPRVELKSHLVAALHAVPPGVAHQSQNRIRVALSHIDQQPPPRRHHQELIQYLRYHIREHRAFEGHAAFSIEDTYTLLATACQCYIEQLPSVPTTRATRPSSSGRVDIIFFHLKQQH